MRLLLLLLLVPRELVTHQRLELVPYDLLRDLLDALQLQVVLHVEVPGQQVDELPSYEIYLWNTTWFLKCTSCYWK